MHIARLAARLTVGVMAAVLATAAVAVPAAHATGRYPIEVDVTRYRYCWRHVNLVDADTNDRNPRVVRFDINKANRQIAHVIDRVLRPLDLP